MLVEKDDEEDACVAVPADVALREVLADDADDSGEVEEKLPVELVAVDGPPRETCAATYPTTPAISTAAMIAPATIELTPRLR